ncbi:hypothetical protein ASF61_16945 [Duganella sp. Leaf126]|uniref:hypothetical protein n=1 Tax=Duganella sp. Leaf126 TaxID=1736266 RepID=UPI0006FC9B7F|nr:hypothetical protein [Duganella sp. Leaf126]KQQ32021.1 hypothetical protein ASF61_16945 [Duganella sp. Leaf126]
MNRLSKECAAEVARLEALAGLVAAMLSTMSAVRSDERAALLHRCAATADGVARELAHLQLVEGRA